MTTTNDVEITKLRHRLVQHITELVWEDPRVTQLAADQARLRLPQITDWDNATEDDRETHVDLTARAIVNAMAIVVAEMSL